MDITCQRFTQAATVLGLWFRVGLGKTRYCSYILWYKYLLSSCVFRNKEIFIYLCITRHDTANNKPILIDVSIHVHENVIPVLINDIMCLYILIDTDLFWKLQFQIQLKTKNSILFVNLMVTLISTILDNIRKLKIILYIEMINHHTFHGLTAKTPPYFLHSQLKYEGCLH